MYTHFTITTIIKSLSLSQILWPVFCDAAAFWPWPGSHRSGQARESYSVGRSTFYRDPVSASGPKAPTTFLQLVPERDIISPGSAGGGKTPYPLTGQNQLAKGSPSQPVTAALPRRPGTATKQVGGKVTVLLPPQIKPPGPPLSPPATPAAYRATPVRQQDSYQTPSLVTVRLRDQPLVRGNTHDAVSKATVNPSNLRKQPRPKPIAIPAAFLSNENSHVYDKRPRAPKPKPIVIPAAFSSQKSPDNLPPSTPPSTPPRKRRKSDVSYVEPFPRRAFSAFRPPESQSSGKGMKASLSDESLASKGRPYEEIDVSQMKPQPERISTRPPQIPPRPKDLGRKQSVELPMAPSPHDAPYFRAPPPPVTTQHDYEPISQPKVLKAERASSPPSWRSRLLKPAMNFFKPDKELAGRPDLRYRKRHVSDALMAGTDAPHQPVGETRGTVKEEAAQDLSNLVSGQSD
ncbi:hypothetical protein CP533_4413 [Ophiocordyceps camponoti-saundersi (nom. inval.)]|nr:hypothetical protein CP533_4413 [Ophiocordyceps camponoti-saundersi (nom. inval.)]